MREFAVVFFLVLGGVFSLLSAVGIFRFPDLYTRMQAATKAGTLGAACLVLAFICHFASAKTILQGFLVVYFLFLTAPVSAQLIAKAAHQRGVKLWQKSVRDELREKSPPNPNA